jgi:hypothetical protein
MTKILTITVILIAMIQNISAKENNLEMCKGFIEQAKAYKDTLKNEKSGDATLAFHKENIVTHCGTVVAKVQYKRDFFPNLMVKDAEATVEGCKTSIKIASNYKNDASNKEMLEAYKENILDNCGTLVAYTKPAFCLFDVAKTSSVQERIIDLCVVAIKDAHETKSTTKDVKALAVHKANIVEKCGNIHKTL